MLTPRHRWIKSAIVLAQISGVAAIAQPEGTLTGTYAIHGGDVTSQRPITAQDRKVTISFGGEAARHAFEGLGPESRVSSCGVHIAETRDRGDVRCWTQSGRYSCVVGFDLINGKSRYSAVC